MIQEKYPDWPRWRYGRAADGSIESRLFEPGQAEGAGWYDSPAKVPELKAEKAAKAETPKAETKATEPAAPAAPAEPTGEQGAAATPAAAKTRPGDAEINAMGKAALLAVAEELGVEVNPAAPVPTLRKQLMAANAQA